jgi:hypothetical protein
MKTYPSIMFFGGIFLFFMTSQMNLPKKVSTDVPPVQGNSINFINITPTCLDRSDIPENEMHWLYIPKDPSELATNEYYGYLSGQLIRTGVVNASDCPLNGLWPNGYANSCGMEKSHQVSIHLQNVYDEEILAAGKGVGVPPVMIKQLIRYESQFWPLQMGPYHFGLGHLTYLGARNALDWDRSLFEDTYAQYVSETPINTINWPRELLAVMDASCPNCAEKIDIPKAEQSIAYIAKVLMAYCRQTSQVIYNATKRNSSEVIDYATIWKLTLFNYNVGPLCVYDAVYASYQAADKGDADNPFTRLSWDSIKGNIADKSCSRGINYVDNIIRPYYDFKITP